MTSQLTVAEKLRYDACKETIKKGMATVFEVGASLRDVKESKLYRAEFKTFDEFCLSVHQLGKAYAYRLIEAAGVKESVSPAGDVLQSERAARELGKVPPEARKHVLESVLSGGEKVTPETIKKAATLLDVNQQRPRKETDKSSWPKDAEGHQIPPPAWPYWDRREEVQPWLSQTSAIKCAIEKALKEGDAFFAFNGNPAISYLQNAYGAIANMKPHAVCTDCQGWFTKVKSGGCSTCHNTGLISKHQWDVCSRSEVKALRAKANEARA